MASISSGRLVFKDCNGQYRRSRLGKINKKQAAIIVSHVEAIVSAQVTNTPVPRSTADWLSNLGDDLHKRFVSLGLADERKADTAMTLAQLRDRLLETMQGRSPNSIKHLTYSLGKLLDFLGPQTLATTVTPTQARDFIAYLELETKHAQASIGNFTKKSKQLFNYAIKLGLITENPFQDIRVKSMATERKAYVSVEAIERVLACCDCPQMRLLLALCRYAGLRCPSEILTLTPQDIDLATFKIHIRDGKTGERYVPILPELRPYIFDAYDAKRKRLINRWCVTNDNLRGPVLVELKKANVEPWPRLFHTLRASCQTDMMNAGYPAYQVCKWLGNSAAVMEKHYLRETDAVFNRVIEEGLGVGTIVGKEDPTSSENHIKPQQDVPAIPVVSSENESQVLFQKGIAF